MDSITITTTDREKTELLVQLLQALNFVNGIKWEKKGATSVDIKQKNDSFFDLAGIWQDRAISQQSLRRRCYCSDSDDHS